MGFVCVTAMNTKLFGLSWEKNGGGMGFFSYFLSFFPLFFFSCIQCCVVTDLNDVFERLIVSCVLSTVFYVLLTEIMVMALASFLSSGHYVFSLSFLCLVFFHFYFLFFIFFPQWGTAD